MNVAQSVLVDVDALDDLAVLGLVQRRVNFSIVFISPL